MPSLQLTSNCRGGSHGLESTWRTRRSPEATAKGAAPVKDHVRTPAAASKCSALVLRAACVASNTAVPVTVALGAVSSNHIVPTVVESGLAARVIAVHAPRSSGLLTVAPQVAEIDTRVGAPTFLVVMENVACGEPSGM